MTIHGDVLAEAAQSRTEFEAGEGELVDDD